MLRQRLHLQEDQRLLLAVLVDDDDETDSDIELAKIRKTRERAEKQRSDSDDENDSIMYSDEDEEIQSPRKQKQRGKDDDGDEVDRELENARPGRQKRIPPRTPYALYNLVPIPVSSDVEVRKLLALATARRETRLLCAGSGTGSGTGSCRSGAVPPATHCDRGLFMECMSACL